MDGASCVAAVVNAKCKRQATDCAGNEFFVSLARKAMRRSVDENAIAPFRQEEGETMRHGAV
jgi:hypothetical protein